MCIQKLIAMSNHYGADARYVLAGGGNTSYKDGTHLFVKGSGAALSTITADGFVKMDSKKLSEMLKKTYPESDAQREAQALADMMAARCLGEGHKRPSVEALLHNLIPYTYVLHVHPALINGLTCAQDGQARCAEIFANTAVWIGLTKPGYVLSVACNKALDAYKQANGSDAQVILLQNHGIFYAANTVEEIDELVATVDRKLQAQLTCHLDSTPIDDADCKQKAAAAAPVLRMLFGKGAPASCTYFTTADLTQMSASEASFAPLADPYSPDHIVYCKAHPLYIPAGGDVAACFAQYEAKHGCSPKIAVMQGVGAFALGATPKDANTAKALFLNALEISVYAKSFGGCLHLPQDMVDFIAGWEVESYRIAIANKGKVPKRLEQKITIITGSAQGFGKGIAQEMAEQGALIVVADLNYDGAVAFADELNALYGAHKALAVKVNVADEPSVQQMIQETVLYYGGLDTFVSNAGVLKAGSLAEMDKKSFEFVTSINYTAYFVCAKYASAVMQLQHSVCPEYFMDIVEINSKSGLVGSNKNFAYAGSKFGGIGLTQSFAMELVEYNIKVNAICPGNFYDGPLWSDPDRGLFVQYLHAGKVPGAKTVEDVKRFYVAKTPIKRGCTPKDVAKAILYVVEQTFETGQAVPVTGGQEMLN